jgi:hypothetical protein
VPIISLLKAAREQKKTAENKMNFDPSNSFYRAAWNKIFDIRSVAPRLRQQWYLNVHYN